MDTQHTVREAERAEEDLIKRVDALHKKSFALEDVGDIDEFVAELAVCIGRAGVLRHMRVAEVCTPKLVACTG